MTSQSEHPAPRDAFITLPRTLRVNFYTSNLEKFLQARAVFERFGLVLHHFQSTTEPYSEDYSLDKHSLLARAISQVLTRVGRASVFFVEDTSVRIDALSSDTEDVPGLAIKEWFETVTFDELNAQLGESPRGATVRSDIALYIPQLGRPVFFSAETVGRIATSAPNFAVSVQHPWLTPETFNGWFVPEGSDRRLGEMSFEESWSFDFRVKAFEALIHRLEEYAACLNLTGQAFSTRISSQAGAGQLTLLPDDTEVLIVTGRTCAGKTTLGQYLSQARGFHYVEASDVLESFRNRFEPEPEQGFKFAEKTLARYGPDAVARRIVARVRADPALRRIVVTGFRTVEEVETVLREFPRARAIFVKASERTRYERNLRRGRPAEPMTLSQFRAHNSQQYQFGLLRVAEDIADVVLENEGQLEAYFRAADALVTDPFPSERKRFVTLRSGQLYRCLTVLEQAGHPLSCLDIERATISSGARVRDNNANKVLKAAPEFAQRLGTEQERVHYRILDPGRAFLRLADQLANRES